MPIVNRTTCIGCTSCTIACPEVFQMKPTKEPGEERSSVIPGKESVYNDDVADAIHICPVDAISNN